MEVVRSHNGTNIRLTTERWTHIVENHDDLAGRMYEVLEAIADPDVIAIGNEREFIALRRENRHALVVIYKEMSATDGFIITAFQTSKAEQLIKSKKILWKKQRSKKQ